MRGDGCIVHLPYAKTPFFLNKIFFSFWMSIINTNCLTFKYVIKTAYRADIHMLKVDSPWQTKDYTVSFFSYINHYIVEKPQSLLIILSDLRLSG